MDVEASPEDIDFEGLNGRVNRRKTQFRWFPQIGQDWNLIASLEDPDPNINNGEAVSLIPDLIFSFRRDWFGRFHVKSSLVLRQIEGRWEIDDSVKDNTFGWACRSAARRRSSAGTRATTSCSSSTSAGVTAAIVNDLATLGRR